MRAVRDKWVAGFTVRSRRAMLLSMDHSSSRLQVGVEFADKIQRIGFKETLHLVEMQFGSFEMMPPRKEQYISIASPCWG